MSNSFLLFGNFCQPIDPLLLVWRIYYFSGWLPSKTISRGLYRFLQRLSGMLEFDIISPWHLSRLRPLQWRLQLPPEIKGSRARIYQTLPRLPLRLWYLSDIFQQFSCWQVSRKLPERFMLLPDAVCALNCEGTVINTQQCSLSWVTNSKCPALMFALSRSQNPKIITCSPQLMSAHFHASDRNYFFKSQQQV